MDYHDERATVGLTGQPPPPLQVGAVMEPIWIALHPKLPVYSDAPSHAEDVDAMFEAATTTVVAICPGGHFAQVFEPNDGPVRTDHQPCPGAWWFVSSSPPYGSAAR